MRAARRTRVAPASLDGLPLPAWQFDPSGHALQVNAAFLAWCGRTETEMLGLGWQTLVHSEDLVTLRDAWAALPPAATHDVRLRRADGAWRWLRLALAQDAGALTSCAQDVTDLVESRDAARQAAELRRDILDQLPAFVVVKDAENNVLDANRTANLYFTGEASSMRGHNCYEMFPPEVAERWHAQDLQVLESAEALSGVVEQMACSGPPRWHRMDKVPFTPAGASGPLCLVMGVEISAEKALELRLREQVEDSEALLRVLRQREYEQSLILDNIPVMLLYKDTDNRVLRANRHAADVLGVPSGEIEGRHLGLTLPEDAAALFLHDLEVLRSRRPLLNIEAAISTRRGERRTLRLHHLPCCDATGALTRLMVVGEDITLTRHYEQELERRASHAEALAVELERGRHELQLILDHLPARIVYKDTRNHVLRMNSFGAALLGRTPEDVQGRHLAEVYGADAAEHYYADDLEVLRTRKPLSNLIEHFDLPSGVHWMRTEKVPLKDASGEVTGIVVLSLDITAQINAERALERKRAELQLLLDSSPAVILSQDTEGRVLRVNRAAQRHFGWHEDEVVGRGLRELLGASASEWLNDGYLAMQSGRAQHRAATPLRAPGASEALRYWQLDTVPVQDDHGRAGGVLLMAHDITERKRMEDELRRQKEEMQIILDHIPTSIIFKDAENILLKVNRAAADALGLRVEDMEGQPADRFYPDPDGRMWQEDLNVMRSRRPRLRQLWRLLLPDGGERWMRYHKIPHFDVDGHAVGVLVVSEDHSAELAAQEALELHLHQAQRHEAEIVTLLDALPVGLMLIGPDGRLLRMNRAAAEFLAAEREARLGQDPYDLLGEAAADWRTRDQAVLESGAPMIDVITDVQCADGRRRRLRTLRTRYEDTAGTVVGVLLTFRDIGGADAPG